MKGRLGLLWQAREMRTITIRLSVCCWTGAQCLPTAQDAPLTTFCYFQLLNEWPSLAILTYGRIACTKYPLLLGCGVWDKFQSGFPGDLSPQKNGGWCEQCKDFIPCPPQLDCLHTWNVSHPQSALPPPSTRESLGHLGKCRHLRSTCLKSKRVTPMLHV